MHQTLTAPALHAERRELGQPPSLSPRVRAAAAVASALISAVVVSSVVVGITATPELVGQLVAAPAAASRA